MKHAITKLDLSAMEYDPALSRPRHKSGRILKVARTINNVSVKDDMMPRHIAGAIERRTMDRRLYPEGWPLSRGGPENTGRPLDFQSYVG